MGLDISPDAGSVASAVLTHKGVPNNFPVGNSGTSGGSFSTVVSAWSYNLVAVALSVEGGTDESTDEISATFTCCSWSVGVVGLGAGHEVDDG